MSLAMYAAAAMAVIAIFSVCLCAYMERRLSATIIEFSKTIEQLSADEVNSRIDWLVKNMPFAPPVWATDLLGKLINQKQRLG